MRKGGRGWNGVSKETAPQGQAQKVHSLDLSKINTYQSGSENW